ncbi:MAG TPA: hypothetical protein VLC46_25480 [Thermoanaerobaculia bacterium]|nr:hypothetical protein [Thermoanaerobaculia bacterium]
MSKELVGVVIGGAIGIVAALLGSAVTFWLARIDDLRKQRAARKNALTSCRYEAAAIASTLVTVDVTKVPELAAIERVINGGYLSEISQDAARELLLFRTLVHDLNETMTRVENLTFSSIAAGQGGVRNEAVSASYERAKNLCNTIAERANILVQVLAAEVGDRELQG